MEYFLSSLRAKFDLKEGTPLNEHQIKQMFDKLEGQGSLSIQLEELGVSLLRVFEDNPDIFVRVDKYHWNHIPSNQTKEIRSVIATGVCRSGGPGGRGGRGGQQITARNANFGRSQPEMSIRYDSYEPPIGKHSWGESADKYFGPQKQGCHCHLQNHSVKPVPRPTLTGEWDSHVNNDLRQNTTKPSSSAAPLPRVIGKGKWVNCSLPPKQLSPNPSPKFE